MKLNRDIVKNLIRKAIIDEAKDWPLVEKGRTAGTETAQAAPPKTSAEKQAVKLYGAYIEYIMNSGNSEYMHKDQRNKLALKMLKDKFKVPSKLKSKLKDKKYHDKFTDYKSIVWEGKLTEDKWWDDMSPDAQSDYLDRHPDSEHGGGAEADALDQERKKKPIDDDSDKMTPEQEAKHRAKVLEYNKNQAKPLNATQKNKIKQQLSKMDKNDPEAKLLRDMLNLKKNK